MRNLLILEPESSISRQYKKFFQSWLFLLFAGKVRQVSVFWQCFEYILGSSSKYAWVLNISFPKYREVLFPELKDNSVFWSVRKFRFLKYKYIFRVSVSWKLGSLFMKKYKRLFIAIFLGKSIRNFFTEKLWRPRSESQGFHFRKYKKSFLLKKRKKFF